MFLFLLGFFLVILIFFRESPFYLRFQICRRKIVRSFLYKNCYSYILFSIFTTVYTRTSHGVVTNIASELSTLLTISNEIFGNFYPLYICLFLNISLFLWSLYFPLPFFKIMFFFSESDM